jgi:hypothetical protein
MADHERKDLNRREFLRKAAITGAVAWAVPIIQSVSATPAYAQTQGSVFCPHSTPGGSGSSCMQTCQGVCAAQGCSAGSGNRCNGPCNPGGSICSSGSTCCDAACNSANWNCKTGTTCLASATFAGC